MILRGIQKREPDEAKDALNSNYNDDQPKTNRKMVIAGDSLLHRKNSRKMMVNKIPSVKLTKRGDNLPGTVSRLTTYISKHSNVHLDIVLMAGTNDLSKRDVTPEVLIKELNDSITVIKRLSNVEQIFLCETSQRFEHHNINTKVCLFNELLVERFLITEDFLMVVDTVQTEIKFYYEDGLHLSNLGNFVALYNPNCIRFLLLQATNLVSVPDKIVKHLFEVAVVLNNMVEVILNRHMGHRAHLKLGVGMYNTLKQLFYISNRQSIVLISKLFLNIVCLKNSLGYLKLLLTALTIHGVSANDNPPIVSGERAHGGVALICD